MALLVVYLPELTAYPNKQICIINPSYSKCFGFPKKRLTFFLAYNEFIGFYTSIPKQFSNVLVMNNSGTSVGILLTLRSHTTGEFHGSHTGSILPSHFQKTIVIKVSARCGSKNYGTCFKHSRLRTKNLFVRYHMTTCLKKSLRDHCANSFFTEKSIIYSNLYFQLKFGGDTPSM